RKADDAASFAALAFKIINDSFVGQLTFMRVYSGQLNSGTSVLNSTKDKRERIGRLLLMHANKREEIKEMQAGNSCAAVGMEVGPGEPGVGCVFENDIGGGVIPKEFIGSIEKGIREAMQRGVLVGYLVIDVKASLFDGSYHDVDSSGPAFEVVASMAF